MKGSDVRSVRSHVIVTHIAPLGLSPSSQCGDTSRGRGASVLSGRSPGAYAGVDKSGVVSGELVLVIYEVGQCFCKGGASKVGFRNDNW